MKRFKNILYAVNALNFSCSGLSQAVRWAHENGGSCTIKVVYPDYPKAHDELPPAFIQKLEQDLLRQVHDYLDQHSIDKSIIEIGLMASAKPALALVNASINSKSDILIKAAEDESSAGFRAFDNTILRNAACPVYLVRNEPCGNDSMAVAIDAETTTPEERELAIKLLRVAYSMAHAHGKKLHVISCWQYIFDDFVSNSTWSHLSDAETIQLLRAHEKSHFEQLCSLIEASGACSDDLIIHHKRGAPESIVPLVLKSHEINTLVIGSLSRAGFLGLLIGNTAENLLQKLSCSVLTFKPDEFKSPLEAS
ncbi:universal stress protein [Idiomarina abyssalis]|uniref:Universal stress protein n=1 Tax=Idiomarina abyssalis TaxID=86102 RepID=A0A8I1G9M9_9GAMM|nr:universal stress protein [Idiomarina abyssalis]MBJ7267724.1 universal stress protein [Idiomarina abyssalis]MBJ7274762.1 universal stress protein [Idiomarina abyssalis]MBJ7316180.1 universal stress protein [Idiomarina abyssalis]